MGALWVGTFAAAVRGCSAAKRVDRLEERLAKVEGQLGLGDAGAPSLDTTAGPDAGVAATSGPDKTACSLARVAAYQAWDDASSAAKSSARSAEAKCADIWSDRKKKACYYAATSEVRAAQSARDAAMKGGKPARDAVHAVKSDSDAVERARAASEAAFNVCHDENEL